MCVRMYVCSAVCVSVLRTCVYVPTYDACYWDDLVCDCKMGISTYMGTASVRTYVQCFCLYSMWNVLVTLYCSLHKIALSLIAWYSVNCSIFTGDFVSQRKLNWKVLQHV